MNTLSTPNVNSSAWRKTVIAAVLAGTAIVALGSFASSPAAAQEWRNHRQERQWNDRRWRGNQWNENQWRRNNPRIYTAPGYYYAPPPIVYAPPPVHPFFGIYIQ